MWPSKALFGLLAASSSAVSEPVQGVSQAVYDRIFRFLRISQSLYALDNCILPGQPVLSKIYDATTDINGRVYRDDATKEIIVGFRGTASAANMELNTNYTLAPLDSNPSCSGCQVHGGYYKGFLSVAEQVKEKVDAAVAAYPDYGIVVTGHSLGASTAAITASHLALRHANVTAYTYGEPRTGNGEFAAWLDARFSAGGDAGATRFFRVTHANDGIVDLPGAELGYVHHGFEFWLEGGACSAARTWRCGGEQRGCALGRRGDTGLPHSTYCGVASYDCPAPGDL